MAIKILVVEDNAPLRQALVRFLEGQDGFTVVGAAENGEDGLDQAGVLRPDVVVMDINMPGLDGIEATRLICGRLPQVKVIILSFCDSQSHRSQTASAGASGYVLKMTAGQDLVPAILNVVKGECYFGPDEHGDFSG